MKALMTLEEAAAETPFSVHTLKRAVKTTDPKADPKPLRARRFQNKAGKPTGPYMVTEEDLRAWIHAIPDA